MDHAPNPEYIDANHGGVVIVLDRLFGTFVAERNDLSCRYGLTTPLLTNNPIGIAFHEWLELLEGLRKVRSWREAIGGLFGPPGWQPDYRPRGERQADGRTGQSRAEPRLVAD